MKIKWPIVLSLLVVLCPFTLPLQGHEPFQVLVRVSAEEVMISAPNLVDLKRDLRTTRLQELAPIYTPTSPVTFDINLRGLIAYTSFAANSTTLTVNIPNAGITTSFDGGSRDQSFTLFKDFIKEGSSLPKLLKAYARYSPIDPIAGNPNSLMGQMAQSDYLLGKLSPLSGCEDCFTAQPVVHQFQVGTFATRAFCNGFDTTLITAPLRYSYSPDYRWAVTLDAPLSYIRNGGASSFIGSLGLSVRIPISTCWSLTPTARGGASGSLDLACAGSFVSTGLLSVYDVKLRGQVLSLTNYAGYFVSTNLWLTGLNYNYRLNNTVFKNGLSLTSCRGLTFCNRLVHFKVSFVDTYFTGDRLFLNHFDEVKAALITQNLSPYLDYDSLSLEIAYQFGENSYKGYLLNMIYQF